MGANPEISKNTHKRTFHNIAVFITRFLAPTSGSPIPGVGAAGLPISIPRGAAARGGTFECTMRLGRTGAGNGRMNWRRRLGKAPGLRGKVGIHRCRGGRRLTHIRATRILSIHLGGPVIHQAAILRGQRFRKFHYMPSGQPVPRRGQIAIEIVISGRGIITRSRRTKTLPK